MRIIKVLMIVVLTASIFMLGGCGSQTANADSKDLVPVQTTTTPDTDGSSNSNYTDSDTLTLLKRSTDNSIECVQKANKIVIAIVSEAQEQNPDLAAIKSNMKELGDTLDTINGYGVFMNNLVVQDNGSQLYSDTTIFTEELKGYNKDVINLFTGSDDGTNHNYDTVAMDKLVSQIRRVKAAMETMYTDIEAAQNNTSN